MNIVQPASHSQDKVGNLVKHPRADNRKETEVSNQDAAKQAKNIKKPDPSSPSLNKNIANEAGKDKGQDKLEVNEYLKILSRLENKLNLDQLKDDDLDKISASLEERILMLSDQQKTRLKNMPFFKENGIENIKDLKQTLFDMFKDVDEREPLFEFLKSPEFMSLLLNESNKSATYSAIPQPNNGNGPKNMG